MKKIIILGGGRIGKVIAIDLLRNNHTVYIADKEHFLPIVDGRNKISYICLDLRNQQDVINLVKDYDLVVCAVPGFMGYKLLETVIGVGKNVVDVSFFPENSMELDKLAKQTGSISTVDCGVAPGMSNIIFGNLYNNIFDNIESFECLVGGLPKERTGPYFYKAPFSPIDVIEEYTRPARYRSNHEIQVVDPFDTIKQVHFPGVGDLEAIITDGLRTLLSFDDVPYMVEKTLRYPKHLELMKIYKDLGLFKEEYIDMTSKLLFPKWKLESDDQDITIMEIKVQGNINGNYTQKIYRLYDEYDTNTKFSSMSRTTGYVASAVAELILNNKLTTIGVNTPESIGMNSNHFNSIKFYLEERNIYYKEI